MSGQVQLRAEEVVRALAAAAAAVRLYPPTSEIPAQTVQRFVQVSEAVTLAARGPVRFVVEPKAFKLGDQIVAEGQAQVTGLAEMLYAHQVGQLIVAPGLTADETNAFLRCAGSDASAVREEGGLRAVIVQAGVSQLAVIEVTLRASTDEGLAGLDLTSAPLDAIGPAVLRSAASWARSAASGEGRDEIGEVINGLESAARELAAERVAAALLQLDEATRAAVLAAAIRPDAGGRVMEGALSVIANMRPATLARLMTLAAARTGGDAGSIMSKLELGPEAMRALELLLRPSPRTEAESGVPPVIDASAIASDAVAETEDDDEAMAMVLATRDPAGEAVRALATTMCILDRGATAESIESVGEAMPRAVAAGAFPLVRTALAQLDILTDRPELQDAVERARRASAQPEALLEGLLALSDAPKARDAAAVAAAAGVVGAEAVVEAWLLSSEAKRPLLVEIGRAMPEQFIAATGRRIRAGDPVEVRELAGMLGRLGDRRSVSVLSLALDHQAREVRLAAIAALETIDAEESWAAIISALTHPDETTARAALETIRRTGRRRAVPAMLAVLQLRTSGTRNHDLKREIIEDVRTMGATEAIPVLKRIASNRLTFRRKPRELRDAARRAVTDLQAAEQADGEKVR
ncbi:MAG: HEAT repeat domain-containing protein [Coriobacteriia bacterium]|nr:HEAT repeat domain-containing protein [Coriobacteriia bacterium]